MKVMGTIWWLPVLRSPLTLCTTSRKCLVFISHQSVLQFRMRRSLSAPAGSPFTARLLTIKCHPEQSDFYTVLAAFTPFA